MCKRILFCNVGYLEFYDSALDTKPIENGGEYPRKNKTGGEINNFRVYEDGKCYGFVEQGSINATQKTIHIERIDSNYKGKDEIPNVTVVFCANSPLINKTVIVGWYKNATVFRRVKELNGIRYNITANGDDAVRIPEKDRTMEFSRANSGKFGFGESNLRYADEDSEEVKRFVSKVFDYIEEKRYIWTERNENEYLELGISKETMVKAYKRNSAAREACLDFNGYKCAVCGFESEKIYGEGFEHLIHVHHIKPISEQGIEYSVDPKTDLMPVCPNCHTALHTKVNGRCLSVEEFKKRYEKIEKESNHK